MHKISMNIPVQVSLSYCLLAISVMTISLQSRTLAQGVATKDSAVKSGSHPVVQIKTEPANGENSSLNFQSDAFDVVPPDWFSEPVTDDDNSNLVSFYVIGFDDEQLDKEVDNRLQSEIDRYVDQQLGASAHQYVQFSEEEIEQVLVKNEVRAGIYFDGNKQTPVDFYFAHLKFDPSFEALANSKWVEKRQESRLVQFGFISVASLLLIGFMFGGLRLNTATSGFYQGRLQFFVAIVILGIVSAGIYFGTQIDWI